MIKSPALQRSLAASLCWLSTQVAVVAWAAPHSATAPASKPATRPAEARADQATPKDDHLVVTHREVSIDGHLLKYTATAGTMLLKDEAGKPRANFFFVAYAKDGDGARPDPATRPVTFLFNGGPGAAAVWLHLGAVGPKKIAMNDSGDPPPTPPYQLIDNPGTWLDTTDLVFIDPVGTGYSRPAEGVKGEEFYGVDNDIRSVAEFVRLYVTRNGRWTSPKFLAGESYGTTRAAALSEYLLEHTGIAVNGIVFISTVLDFSTLAPARGNDLPYQLYLPTYAATAWYFKKLDADLQHKDVAAVVAEVQKWAETEYAVILSRGDALDDAGQTDVARRLSRYTSLPADWIVKSRLRIAPHEFRKRLLADRQRIVGRFDGRLTATDLDPASDRIEVDPGFPQLYGAYTACMTDYARRTLKFESDLPYEVLTDRVHPWNFDTHGMGYLDVASRLRSAMQQNPSMKVFFASGWYDLATPPYATDYTVSHMGLTPELRGNISRGFYEGGHMMYHNKPALLKLRQDVEGFIRGATP